MKGISFNKYNRKYEAYLILDKQKISIGSFYKKDKAILRLKGAQEVVGEGHNILEWLDSNPNKKFFLCTQEQFEEEYDSFLEEDEEPVTKDGYHEKLNFAFTKFRRLQKRYEDELEEKSFVVKDVLFMDSSPDLFRDRNTVNFRYWKKHLGELGQQIFYNNLHFTKFDLKMALLKVFQRNIRLPKKLKPDSKNYLIEWKIIEQEFDEMVDECIYGKPENIYSIPERKPQHLTKIIYNPKMNLSKKERQKISTEHTSTKRKEGTLKKLVEYYTEGISKKKLSRDSGISLPTIRNHWDNLQKLVA